MKSRAFILLSWTAFFAAGFISAWLVLKRPAPENLQVHGYSGADSRTGGPALPEAGRHSEKSPQPENPPRNPGGQPRDAQGNPAAGSGFEPSAGGAQPAPTGRETSEPASATGALEGSVLDAESRPVDGVSVEINGRLDDGTEIRRRPAVDAAGRFIEKELPPGYYYVSTDCAWLPKKQVKVTEGGTTRVELGGSAWVRVRGAVRAPGGTAFSEAHMSVSCQEKGEYAFKEPITDLQGRFDLGLLEPGTYKWRIWRYENNSLRNYGAGTVSFPVIREFEWNLTLEDTIVSGFVVDSVSGAPVVGANLTLCRQGLADMHGSSGMDGAFAFAGFSPGVCSLYVVRKGCASMKIRVNPADPDSSSLRIEMRKAVKVKVRVTDAAGKAIPGFFAFFYEKGAVYLDGGCANHWIRFEDAAGIAEVDDIAAGIYTVKVEADGYRTAIKRDVRIGEGGDDVVEFALEEGEDE